MDTCYKCSYYVSSDDDIEHKCIGKEKQNNQADETTSMVLGTIV